MILDIEGKEINVGDDVIMGASGGCFKAKITKETQGRIHYCAWDNSTKSYRTYSWYGNKSSYLISNMYKV